MESMSARSDAKRTKHNVEQESGSRQDTVPATPIPPSQMKLRFLIVSTVAGRHVHF